MKPILYEMTEDALDKGLEGVPVGYSTTTYQDGKRGMLFLAGRSLNRCFDMEIEELLFLVLHGFEPSASEKLTFSHQLKESCRLTEACIDMIERQNSSIPLSELIKFAMLGFSEVYASIEPLELLAKIPHLFALCVRHYRRMPLRVTPNIQSDFIERWFRLISLNFVEEQSALHLMRKITSLHLDPGPSHPASFAARVIGSTGSSYPEALCGYLLAYDTKAKMQKFQKGLEFLHYFHHQATRESTYSVSHHLTPIRTKEIWDQIIKDGTSIFGYRPTKCPKADLLFDLAEQYSDFSLVKTALTVRNAALEYQLFPQEEAIIPALLVSAGWDVDEIVLSWLMISEMVGVLEQLRYDRCDARDGQGILPFAPKFIYKRRD